MRHQKAGKKLNRTGSHRNAMFRNMVTSLFAHGRIRTTHTKAKELRRWADHMITLAKRGDLHARRQALAVMRDKIVVHRLFEQAADRFGERAGGYTRVMKIGRRRGDAAPISLVEFVTVKEKPKKKKPKVSKKAVAAKAKKEVPVKSKEKEKAKPAKAAAQEVPEKKEEAVAESEPQGKSQEPAARPEGESGEAPETADRKEE